MTRPRARRDSQQPTARTAASLLETDLQGLIMTPFDTREFRAEMDQMELGF